VFIRGLHFTARPHNGPARPLAALIR
jgi:hypothetical protein